MVQADFKAEKEAEILSAEFTEAAILPAISRSTKFPFAMRVNSEVCSEDGGETEVAVSSAALALTNAGVPLTGPVTGTHFCSRLKQIHWNMTPAVSLIDFGLESASCNIWVAGLYMILQFRLKVISEMCLQQTQFSPSAGVSVGLLSPQPEQPGNEASSNSAASKWECLVDPQVPKPQYARFSTEQSLHAMWVL